MLPPNNVPLGRFSQEEGISRATVAKWRRGVRFLPDANTGPEDWTSRGKLAAVIETASMNEADLAEYCRCRSIYTEQLRVWREACERANDWERAAASMITRETKDDRKRIQQLDESLRARRRHLRRRPR